jgi:hypothetical protein
LGEEKRLVDFANFIESPAFAKQINSLRRGQPPLEALVIDSLDGDLANEFWMATGDLHLRGLGRPEVQAKGEPDPADDLDEAWRARGLQVVGEEGLETEEKLGLARLLDFVDRELHPAQYVAKQIVVNDDSFLRALGEVFGVLPLQREDDSGASIVLSPRLLRWASKANLQPMTFSLPPGATELQREAAQELAELLAEKNLLINGTERLVFVPAADLERPAPIIRTENEEEVPPRTFYRDGNTIFADIERFGRSKPKDNLAELRRELGDEQSVAALQRLLELRTQSERRLEMARAAGRGELHQYFPEGPVQRVDDPTGNVYRYRIFDAYGAPRFDRTYELSFPDDAESFSVSVVGATGERQEVRVANAADAERLAEAFPEITVILDGLKGDKGTMPGLKVLNRLRP